jgi:N-acetylglucosamine-6-sulfatase
MVSSVSSSLRLLVALAATLSVCVLAAPASAAGATRFLERPNILLLMTDDQTVESMRVMPDVQRLIADQGTTFDNSFVNFSLCCPSRATAFTGQYAHNHLVQGLSPPLGGYVKLDSSSYLPLWLQRAGYRTMHLGKFLNGYGSQNADPTEVPPGWDVWQGSLDPSTYDYGHFTLNENGTLVDYGGAKDRGMYQTDFYAERASELIARYGQSDQPFFFSVAFTAPHHGTPLEFDDPPGLKTPAVAPRHQNAFATELLPMPPSFNEFDASDKPTLVRRRPLLSTDRVASIQEEYQQRLEALLAVDEAVQRIVATLERTGELDRTLIVFTSDNGFMHGEHRISTGKVVLYEPSIRVPLVMRGPGVPPAQHRGQLVTNADLSPTFLEAAGGLAGLPQDGRSLFPVLDDPGLEWGRDLLIEGRGVGLNFNALRTPRYLYARYGTGTRELYDLARDPDELQNLSRDPLSRQLRGELSRRLNRLRRCRGRTCSAAPHVAMRLRPATGCVPGSLLVNVIGRDRDHVRRVSIYAGKRRVGVVRRVAVARLGRALRQVVPTRHVRAGRRFRLRAQLTFDDGRLLTVDRTRRTCAVTARSR